MLYQEANTILKKELGIRVVELDRDLYDRVNKNPINYVDDIVHRAYLYIHTQQKDYRIEADAMFEKIREFYRENQNKFKPNDLQEMVEHILPSFQNAMDKIFISNKGDMNDIKELQLLQYGFNVPTDE